jgi:ketosteroid isomerase-like protein
MNKLYRIFVITGLMILLLANLSFVNGQSWSKEQQGVWKNVQAYWAMYGAGDLEGFLGYMHDDYLGWGMANPLPNSKADAEKWMKPYWSKRTVTVYDIKPVGILVMGDMAVAHYYYSMMIKGEDGKEKNNSGRWTDVLMKQGDKWLLIADHGGQDDEE